MRRTNLGMAGLAVFTVMFSIFTIWLIAHDPLKDALKEHSKGQEYPRVARFSVAEGYGDEWTTVAVICPYDQRSLAEDAIGIEGLDTPEYGPDEGENIVVMMDEDGRFESKTYERSDVDWCRGYQNAHLKAVSELEFRRENKKSPWVLIGSS
ncbi:hypothetical protein [Corynebacterium pelargi]|uniref:Uncharacterized protein n=1 Tax=Corynebacterium pelargi TaxID=1471400 RepID=A0A410W9I4_9CORY|nr:hypothetical protein [Corynebacterium pelargi]QAU52623.1 hypothetical protein CPELA_06805 [Corynebacterium pelargi]GGG77728.1 hypothetical protein GCM10007338_14520 [Corynebacterium pelargi]